MKELLTHNPQLKELILNHIGMSQQGAVFLSQFLLNSECRTSIETFEATKNRIETKIQNLAEAFANMPNLRRLNLMQNNIRDHGMKQLLVSLQKCHKLEYLDLTDNLI